MNPSSWVKSSRSYANGQCVEVQWVKSSHSADGACVEVRWAKSSHSLANGSCVEVARPEGSVLVRDSKLGDDSPVLSFSADEWDEFLAGLKAR